ncbi:MAG: hypothetical protein ACRBBN_12480 [Methyloligellaceae bacterium]
MLKSFVFVLTILFCTVIQAKNVFACDDADLSTLVKRLTNKEAISLCSHHRVFLYQRCVRKGGRDEFTSNCADHTLPIDDRTKNIGLALNSKQRIANYWHCYKPHRNPDCCDHITVKDQRKIGACGKDKTSGTNSSVPKRVFRYSIEVTCKNTNVFDSNSRFTFQQRGSTCAAARKEAEITARNYCKRRNPNDVFVSMRHLSAC